MKSCRLPLHFEPNRLQADLAQIPAGAWVPHFNREYYDGLWSGVALRSVGGKATQLYPDPAAQLPYRDTAILGSCPYLQVVLAAFRCPLKSIRLLKLQAGSSIREHRDYDLGYEIGELRIHIPVVTSAAVEFYLDGQRMVMNEGEAWYLDLSLPHRVENRGTTDRIHLVVDCILNEWLRSLIPADSPVPPQHVDADPAASGQDSFDSFRQLVLADTTLQEKLRPTIDREQFLALILRLGQAHGFRFTAGDVDSALQAARRTWIERAID